MLVWLHIKRLTTGYSSLKFCHYRPIIRHRIKIKATKETYKKIAYVMVIVSYLFKHWIKTNGSPVPGKC
jgi:hypothetical protein